MGMQVCLLKSEPTVLQAYTHVRREGERELGAVLLGITNELVTFDFTETFVDPFAVRPLPTASASRTLPWPAVQPCPAQPDKALTEVVPIVCGCHECWVPWLPSGKRGSLHVLLILSCPDCRTP